MIRLASIFTGLLPGLAGVIAVVWLIERAIG